MIFFFRGTTYYFNQGRSSATIWQRLSLFFSIYWKSVIVVVTPILLLPIPIMNASKDNASVSFRIPTYNSIFFFIWLSEMASHCTGITHCYTVPWWYCKVLTQTRLEPKRNNKILALSRLIIKMQHYLLTIAHIWRQRYTSNYSLNKIKLNIVVKFPTNITFYLLLLRALWRSGVWIWVGSGGFRRDAV